ncbi:hypothetical protein DSECCO2_490540 [anaerobic digester metagenome]
MVAATDADIQAVFLAVVVLPGEGRLRALFPGDRELLRRQLPPPLLVGLDDPLNLFHLSRYGVADLHGPDGFYGIPAHQHSSRLRMPLAWRAYNRSPAPGRVGVPGSPGHPALPDTLFRLQYPSEPVI